MSPAAVETAGDWSNPSEDWGTSGQPPINPVKVANNQATLAFMRENVIAPTVEWAGGGTRPAQAHGSRTRPTEDGASEEIAGSSREATGNADVLRAARVGRVCRLDQRDGVHSAFGRSDRPASVRRGRGGDSAGGDFGIGRSKDEGRERLSLGRRIQTLGDGTKGTGLVDRVSGPSRREPTRPPSGRQVGRTSPGSLTTVSSCVS